MARKRPSSPTPPSSYELLGQRVQRLVASANARKQRQIELTPEPDDSLEDWERLVDEFATLDGVEVTRTGESYLVSWNPAEVGE